MLLQIFLFASVLACTASAGLAGENRRSLAVTADKAASSGAVSSGAVSSGTGSAETTIAASASANAAAYVSSLIASSSIVAYAKPSQQVKEIYALGDSFTAGVGSNGRADALDDINWSWNCRRFLQAWPEQLVDFDNQWTEFNNGQIPELNFGACTGAKMQDVRDNMLNQGVDWRHRLDYHVIGQPQLAVLTISGNDAKFSTALNDCIYRAWRPGDCTQTLNNIEIEIATTAFESELIDLLVKIVLRGRAAGGAQPSESFQVYIGGYPQFWNHDDLGCNDISWGWYFWDKPTITTEVRRKMNDLVDQLNGVVQTAANSLERLGVVYVDNFISSYNSHRFCEPASADYLQNPFDSKTWFWHQNYGLNHHDEGPDVSGANISSSNTNNVTQQVLNLLIPDPNQQASLSASNPPWNINQTLLDLDSLLDSLDQIQAQAQGLPTGIINSTNISGNLSAQSDVLMSEEVRRSFHPKGTAYGQHAQAFLDAIRQNRGQAAVVSIKPNLTTTPTSTPDCTGNQVQGTCTAGALPSLPPYSGPQPPSCDKADGAGTPYPRLNATQAEKAASAYCSTLISGNIVLDGKDSNPEPYTVAGVAENSTDMVLTVMYDISACPTDKSNSTIDFASLGLNECFADLYTTVSEYCSQDSTWGNYNKDYTLEGGVYEGDCGLWSLSGEPSE